MPEIDYLPKKVLHASNLMGVHADCIAAGAEGCCKPCELILMSVMDSFYGHLSTDEVAIAIIGDLLEETAR